MEVIKIVNNKTKPHSYRTKTYRQQKWFENQHATPVDASCLCTTIVTYNCRNSKLSSPQYTLIVKLRVITEQWE